MRLDLLQTPIDLKYFDKFLFFNSLPQCQGLELFNDLWNFSKESDWRNEDRKIEFSDSKVNIWFVRNDEGCNDYVYNDNLDSIKKVIPQDIVNHVNSSRVKLILSTDNEWEYNHFWEKVVKYCTSIGIEKDKINIFTSNYLSQNLKCKTFQYTFSSIADIKFDCGLMWLDKYPNKFPYNDEYTDFLIRNNKTKKYICLNAHYNEHRHFVVYKLIEKNLDTDGYLSFTLGQGMNFVEHPKERMIEEWDRLLRNGNFDIKNYDLSISMLDNLPIFVKEFGLDNPRDFWKQEMKTENKHYAKFNPRIRPWMIRDIDMIEDSYFCIGVETQVQSDNGNFGNFSEKVMIGWITQPTICISTPLIIEYLKSLGLKSFDMFFDESYDKIIDTDKRLVKVMNEVERICSLEKSTLDSMYEESIEVVKFNQQKIFEFDIFQDYFKFLGEICD